MANLKIDKEITALLVIDPYNDFISEGGKFWDPMRHVAEANNCVPNMLQVLNAARKAEPRVFYAEGDVVAQGVRTRHVGCRCWLARRAGQYVSRVPGL